MGNKLATETYLPFLPLLILPPFLQGSALKVTRAVTYCTGDLVCVLHVSAGPSLFLEKGKLIGLLSLGFRHSATVYSSIMAMAKTGFCLSKEYFQIYIKSDMNN